MGIRLARVVLAVAFVVLGVGLWAAGTASANCNQMPDDPMCQPPPTTPQTSPTPHTSPPVTQHSSSGVQSTQPPVNRTPATNPPRRTPATRAYQPPVTDAAPAEEFVPGPIAIPPAPAIALSGTPPAVGSGVASLTAQPPATSSSSGAATVGWAFGIGVAAMGIGLGARTLWRPERRLDVRLDASSQ
jgi:hypothetical protein